MSQATKSSQVVTIPLAQQLDIEDCLNLKHLVNQCTQDGVQLEDVQENPKSSLAGLDHADLREQLINWALEVKVDTGVLEKNSHPLATMILARMAADAGDYQKALSLAEKAAKSAPTEMVCQLARVDALRHLKRIEEAMELLESLRREFSDRGEFSYQEGCCLEAMGQHEEAAAAYEKAIELNPGHFRAIYRLAYYADLRGDEETALALYKKIGPGKTHSFINAALNMALIYEDLGDYERAINTCREVLRKDPRNHRAKLFLRDIEESTDMYYSPEEAKETERLEAILRVPVSDFELSVRSRNCLNRMNIRSLGDLVRKTEQEMLGYKNFGETSLREIKEMLVSRGLRLGMLREDGSPRSSFERSRPAATVSTTPAIDNAPIDDLELSVRSRKCMDRLNIRTIGDLLALSEADLVAAKNFGRVSLQEIKAKLSERSMSLRQ